MGAIQDKEVLRWKVRGSMGAIQILPLSITRYGTPVYSAKNEIELVRLGAKPAGVGWYRLPAIKAAGLVHKRKTCAWPWNRRSSRGEIVIGRTLDAVQRVVCAQTQRELGLALGYAPEQVEAFVNKKPAARPDVQDRSKKGPTRSKMM